MDQETKSFLEKSFEYARDVQVKKQKRWAFLLFLFLVIGYLVSFPCFWHPIWNVKHIFQGSNACGGYQLEALNKTDDFDKFLKNRIAGFLGNNGSMPLNTLLSAAGVDLATLTTNQTPGLDGQDGSRGPQGVPGVPGSDGKDGSDGTNGTNGANGQDGTSILMPAGTNGQVMTVVGGVPTWVTPGVGGSVTDITAGSGLSGGTVTTSGTFAINAPTCSGTDKLQWTGAAFVCSADADTTYSPGTGLALVGTTFSLTNVGTAGTYGSATQVPVFTVDAQGRITSVTNTTITPAASSIAGAQNLTAASTKVTVTGGTGATLVASSVDVNEAALSLQNIGGALSVAQQGAMNFANIGGSLTTSDITPGTNGQILSTIGGVTTWITPTYLTAEVDGSVTNELQTLSLAGATLTISSGNSVTLPTYSAGNGLSLTGSTFAVNSPTCAGTDKLQWNGTAFICSADIDTNTTYTAGTGINLVGTTFSSTLGTTIESSEITDGTVAAIDLASGIPVSTFTNDAGYLTSFTEVDGSVTNEIQSISLATNTLSLSLGGGSVNLAPYLDNTDAQTLTWTNGTRTLAISGGNSVIIPDADTTYTAGTGLSLAGTTFSSTLGTDITSSEIVDGTIVAADLGTIPVSTFTNDAGYLTAEVDGSVTNELQTLSLAGATLTISSGNSVTLPTYSAGNGLSLTGSTFAVNSPTCSGTDKLQWNGTAFICSADIDTNTTYTAGTGINLVGTTFSSTLGTTIESSEITDGTVAAIDLASGIPVSTFTNDAGYLTSFTEVDGSITNELQTLSLAGATLTISSGNSVTLPTYSAGNGLSLTGSTFAVNSPTCSGTDKLQWNGTAFICSADIDTNTTYTAGTGINLVGTTFSSTLGTTIESSEITDGTVAAIDLASGIPVSTFTNDAGYLTSFTEVDGSITNEIQTISLATNTLSLSLGGGSVNLAPYLDNTDAQTLTWTNGTRTLAISGGNSVIIPDADTTYTAGTGLSLAGTTFSSTLGTDITSSEIVDGTIVAADLGTIPVSTFTNDAGYLTSEVDGSVTNELQTLSLAGATLSISSGNSVTLPTYSAGNGLSLTGSTFAVNSPTCSGTDKLQWNGTAFICSADIDTNTTYTAGTGINLVGTTFSSTLGTTIESSEITDGTVAAIDLASGIPVSTFTNDAGYLTSFTEVDGSITNEIQTISLATNTLSLSLGGGSVDLAPYLDNTDAQTLTWTNGTRTLAISGGNSVIIPDADTTYTAGTGLSLSGTTFSSTLGTDITSSEIVDGTIVAADLGTIPVSTFTNDAGYLTSEVDGSVTNELQTLSLAGATLSISSGNSVTLPTYSAGNGLSLTGSTFAVNSPTCSGTDKLQWNGTAFICSADIDTNTTYTAGTGINLVGTTFSSTLGTTIESSEITDGTVAAIDLASGIPVSTFTNDAGYLTSFTEVDGSITNEIQTISLATNTLSLSLGGGSVDLAPYLDNTDAQTLTWTNGTRTLAISGGNSVIIPDADTTYTAGTGLSLSGTTFSSTLGTDITSSEIVDGTIVAADLGTIPVSTFTNDAGYLTSEVDGSVTNELQTLSLAGATLSISSGNSVTLPTYSAGNGLSLTGSTFAVNSPTCSGTDKLQWNGTAFICSADIDTNTTYTAGTGINLVGTTFSSTLGTTIESSEITDGTVAAIDLASGIPVSTFTNDAGYLTSFTEVDGSITNEIQTISLATNTLSLSLGGGSVDLAPYLDNTDAQTLTWTNGTRTLAISGGNSVIIPDADTTYTAGTGLSLSGTTFSSTLGTDITSSEIVDGTIVAADLGTIPVSTFTNDAGYLTSEVDGSVTNELQTLSLAGATLTISSGNSVTLPTYSAGNGLSLTGSTFAVNSPTCSGTDKLQWNGTAFICSADIDTNTTYTAGTGMTLSGTTFSSTLGTTIESSEITDGTVAAIDLASGIPVSTFTNDAGYLTSFTEVDGSITNEIQTISLATNTLSLSLGGGSVDLAPYLDNTDAQTLTWTNGTRTLAISGGNSVIIPDADTTYTAGTGLSLSGTTFSSTLGTDITSSEIVDGTIVAADLGTIPVSTFTNDAGYLTSEVDGSVTNELQTLSLAGATLSISSGNSVTLPTYSAGNGLSLTGSTFAVNSPTCSGTDKLQWNGTAFICSADIDTNTTYTAGTGMTLSGTTFSSTLGTTIESSEITDGTVAAIDLASGIPVSTFTNDAGYLTSFTEVDGSITNEIQTISLATNTLSLSLGGGSVDLAPYLDNTDAQTLTWTNGTRTLAISGGNSVIIPDADTTYTAGTGLSLSGTTFSSTLGTDITSSEIVDGTIVAADLGTIPVSTFTNDAGYLTSEVDGSVTNELQTLSLAGATLSISSGNSVTLPTYSAGNGLSLTGSTFAVNSPTCSGTDKLQWNGTAFICSADIDTNTTYTAGTGINLVGTTFSSTLGTTIESSEITDGTVAAIDLASGIPVSTFTNDAGYLTSFTEVDGSITNEIQTISLATNTLSLSLGGGSVDLAPYLDNTDAQTLTWTNGTRTLAISGGNSVIIPDADTTYTAGTGLSLSGTTFSSTLGTDITSSEIVDGTIVAADLGTIPVSTFTNDAGYLTSEVDGSVTNELQTLSLAGATLSISSGNSVTLPTYSAGNGLSLTGSTFAVNSPTCSGTDKLQWNGTAFICSADIDTNTTYTAGTGINLVGTTFSSTLGTTIESSEITDGTVAAIDLASGIPVSTFTNDAGYLTSFTEVDGSITNEIQTISLATNTLSLSLGGGSVDLAPYLDNTDAQTLTWTNGTRTLAISGGNSVIIPDADTTYTAGTGLSLSGTTFSSTLGTDITSSEIVDGTITNADLANSTIALAVGTTGTNVNVTGSPVALGGTLTLNIPDASATARGLVTTGAQTFAGAKTFTGNVALNANTTIGDATIDRLTVISQILGGSPLVFQGATDNGFTTTFAITDPTANQTITFPNASGTVLLSGGSLLTLAGSTGTNSTLSQGDTISVLAGTGMTSVGNGTDGVTVGLANTAVTAGAYGSATQVATFTVDAQGRLTAAGNTTITPAASNITGAQNLTAGSTKVTVTGGTGATLVAASVDVNEANLNLANIGGTLPTTKGGTGLTTLGTAGQALTVNAGGTGLVYADPAVRISSLLAANATNTIDNANFAQQWNWNTLTTQNALSLASSTLTSGSLLNIASSSTGITGDIVKIEGTGANTGAGDVLKLGFTAVSAADSTVMNVTSAATGTSSLVARFNDDGTYTDPTPVVIDTNGIVGIGTPNPATVPGTGNGCAAPNPWCLALHIADPSNGNQSDVMQRVAGAGYPSWYFAASNGTTAAPTLSGANATLGSTSYLGYDGTGFKYAAAIEGRVDGTPAANSMPGTLVFLTSPTASTTPIERARITAQGRLGLGTQTPRGIFDVNGAGGAGGIYFNNDTTTLPAASVGNLVLCWNAATSRVIRGANNTACNTSSIRYKQNVAALSEGDGLNTVLALNPVTYEYKADPGKTVPGFIAEEVELVNSDLVVYNEEGQVDGINPDYFNAFTVKAIQELNSKVDTNQTTTITTLNTGLEAQAGSLADLTATLADNTNRITALEQNAASVEDRLAALEAAGATSTTTPPADGIFTIAVNFMEDAVFNKVVTFTDMILVQGPALFSDIVTFDKEVIFNQDAGGRVTLQSGETSVDVTFNTPYSQTPVITATPDSFLNGVEYRVTSVTETGFTIEVQPAATGDIKFSWTAVSVTPGQ